MESGDIPDMVCVDSLYVMGTDGLCNKKRDCVRIQQTEVFLPWKEVM